MTKRVLAFICLILLAGWVSLPRAEAVVAPAPDQALCPSEGETAKQLQQRIEQSQTTLTGLKTFVSGMSLGDVPPSSLFTVDLADENAVARRLDTLKNQIKTNSPSPAVVGLLECAAGYPAQAERVQALTGLQKSVAQVRLDFLGLPKDRRDTLVNAQQSLLIHTTKVSELAREQLEGEKQQSTASQSAENAELMARSAETADLRELAAQRALLEKVREEVAGMKIRFSADLRARTKAHQETAAKLSSLAGSLTRTGTPAKSSQAYAETAAIWRSLVDQVFTRIADPQRYEPIPALPAMPARLLAQLGADADAEAYRVAYRAAQVEHGQLASLRQASYTDERNNLFRLLLEAGRLRSELLKENRALGNKQAIALSAEYFADLYREIRVVPYRLYAFVTTKLLDFLEKARGGIEGAVDIARQLLIFILFLAIPFVIFRAVKWATNKLERVRYQMLREQMNLPEEAQRSIRITTIVIQRVSAYLPWLIMLLGIWIARHLIQGTVFSEASAVLPYLAYYVWYHIFIVFVTGFLGMIAYTGAMQGLTARRKRVQRMAQQLGAFFFISFALLHAAQDVVGEALVYRLIVDAMIYLGLIIWAVVAHRWRPEIILGAKKVLPGWLAGAIEPYCTRWLSWLVCLPAMILVIIGLPIAQIKLWLGQTDMFKRIGAEMFRRRVESATQDKTGARKGGVWPPPAEYLEWFDLGAPADASLLIEPSSGIISDVLQAVETWKRNPGGEHSLAIVGDKGTGKSSLLRVIENDSRGFRVNKITVPPKLTTRDAVLAFFSEQLQCDLSDGAGSLLSADQSMEPTLVLLDEAHNLFLGAIGGFEGYRAFMELVNAGTSNLYWCVTFNQRSWAYLQGVFGGNMHFREALEIPPMTDADVQNLILTRHQRTGFKLSYDAIIRAAQNPEEFSGLSHIETQFFRLLWGQSKGNPRAAIVLWTSALHMIGQKRLRVGIPYFKPIRGLGQAGDDAMFVYAAIVRHENLAAEEAVATTDLAPTIVHDAIRMGLETGAIVLGADGRLRASPTAQFALLQLLTGKNFIHE